MLFPPFSKTFLRGASGPLKTTKQKGTLLSDTNVQVHETVFEIRQMLAPKLSKPWRLLGVKKNKTYLAIVPKLRKRKDRGKSH